MTINNIKGLDEKLLFKNNLVGNNKENNNISFSQFLNTALNNVNKLQVEADNYKMMLATGQVDSIHEVMIASEKANLALQFTLSIRNKVIEAYNEIMRMQI